MADKSSFFPPSLLILPAGGLSTVLYIINSGNVYSSVLSQDCYLLFLLFFFSWRGGGREEFRSVSLRETTANNKDRFSQYSARRDPVLLASLTHSEFIVMVYLKWFPVFFWVFKEYIKTLCIWVFVLLLLAGFFSPFV